ncbi:Cytochrome-b5 reductase [Apiospora arundinis]
MAAFLHILLCLQPPSQRTYIAEMSLDPVHRGAKWPAQIFRSLQSTGWRRTGAWNLLAALVAEIVMMCALLASVRQPGSSFRSDTVLFHGSCEYSRSLNIGLHLLINIISSTVLASSNYFMQILNAPSRHEIDRAHSTFSSLEIGIPSLKNLSLLSNSKRCLWALLLITSLPIHLFFNSSVYETNFRGSSWQLTIASESFLHGSPFFPPGASLAPAGTPSPIVYPTPEDYEPYYPISSHTRYNSSLIYWLESFGKHTNLSDYWDDSSFIRQKLSQISRDVIEGEQNGRWQRLSSKNCKLEYCVNKPRTTYGDVVVVVKPGANTTGWTRAEVYADPHGKAPSWQSRLPRHAVNSLWYSTECADQRPLDEQLYYYEYWSSILTVENRHPCAGALGIYWATLEKELHDRFLTQEEWVILFKNWTGPAKPLEESLGYNNGLSSLAVEYCLADLAPSKECKVIAANRLVFVTTVCILFKIILCAVVLGVLREGSIVTPGDAMDSFISEPDPATLGLSTADVHDIHRLEFRIPHPLSAKAYGEDHRPLTSIPQARTWQPKRRRILSAIPRLAWWRAYAPILIALAFLTCLAELAYDGNLNSFNSDFGHQGKSSTIKLGPISLTSGLIVANIAQLLLSLSYFSYNSLLTRIYVEKELNLYSLLFRPLRVSFPKGDQIVTWRLQLPYCISIPLLATGMVLHWLASNSIFFLIMEGGWWCDTDNAGRCIARHAVDPANRALDPNAVVAVGYSMSAILSLLILAAVLATIPLFASLYRLPGDMIAGGCNSLALSAACHGFYPSRHRDPAGSIDARRLASSNQTPDEETGSRGNLQRQETEISQLDDVNSRDELVKLAQSKLRWGVTPLTSELRDVVNKSGQEALHLGFATEENFISPPVEGELYL